MQRRFAALSKLDRREPRPARRSRLNSRAARVQVASVVESWTARREPEVKRKGRANQNRLSATVITSPGCTTNAGSTFPLAIRFAFKANVSDVPPFFRIRVTLLGFAIRV